jgi:putative molybdopterin biosynthesis protein
MAFLICFFIHVLMSKSSSIQISFSIQAEASLGELHVDLPELKRSLRTLADTQSITHAAQSLGVTYRTLWGRLLTFDAALGCKLVGKARGRGTNLTGKGHALLAALERHEDLFSPPSPERVTALSADLSRALRDQPLLRLLASHDYALAHAFDLLPATASGAANSASVAETLIDGIHMANAGSVECIRALLRGDADLAGYHHTTTFVAKAASSSAASSNSPANALWGRVEDSADFWSVPVMEREQGLIIAPKHKAGVKALKDLARPDLRFVNRQRGSGTRVLLDALMAEAGLVATSIAGYAHEEFTHQAIAATIAAGAADVGPGLRTAAAQFKLHFVPLATETYRIAGRLETRKHRIVVTLLDALRAQAKGLPGYVAIS